jgi:hypothetical protein
MDRRGHRERLSTADHGPRDDRRKSPAAHEKPCSGCNDGNANVKKHSEPHLFEEPPTPDETADGIEVVRSQAQAAA